MKELQQQIETVLSWFEEYLRESPTDRLRLIMFREIRPLLLNSARLLQVGDALGATSHPWDHKDAWDKAFRAHVDLSNSIYGAMAMEAIRPEALGGRSKQTEPPAEAEGSGLSRKS